MLVSLEFCGICLLFLEFLNGKWKEYVLEKAFWEVISIKRDLDQKYAVGSEYAHEWEETQRPELPSTA